MGGSAIREGRKEKRGRIPGLYCTDTNTSTRHKTPPLLLLLPCCSPLLTPVRAGHGMHIQDGLLR